MDKRFTLPTKSSRVDELDPYEIGRDHLVLADKKNPPKYNITIPRFDPEQWVVDYNALMVATIIPIGSRSFKVPAQWRTNADFLGVRWMSADTFNHVYFQYQTNNDYSRMVVAFRANPSEPDKFTVTLTADGEPKTHRLAPYAINPVTGMYECLDKLYGTGKTYPANIIKSKEFNIPEDEMVASHGTKDYIFILNFGDLRTLSSFNGPIISPKNISMISFDCVEASHGLGKEAYVAEMVDLGNGKTRIELGGINTNAVLTPGDKLQAVWRWHAPGSEEEFSREDEFLVESFTGFGTSAFSVIVTGSLPGVFAGCDAFYGRYLQQGTPVVITDSVKYFTDFTMTGGVQTVNKRNYPQKVNGMGMTSGFDDGYNLTPERQVKMTHALGYRNWWTTYVGMSHYFNGRTAYQHKVTGELTVENIVLEFPVMYAGEAQSKIHFIYGAYPEQGYASLRKNLSDLFGSGLGNILPIDGATSSTSTERMAAVDPAGDLYWWDLEANKPGPAFDNMVAAAGDHVPRAVVWAQGDQDSIIFASVVDRTPMPSLARSKAATEAVFAKMRELWGAGLKIFVQEQGLGWGLSIPSQPNIPILMGQPTYLDVQANTWGDLVFTWLSYGDDPRNFRYRVEIYHPTRPTQILRSIEVPGTQIDSRGLIYCDYANEVNVPDAISVFGDQFPWNFLRWRVVRTDSALVASAISESTIVPDNNAFVKKVIGCGINSLIGGYFNDLSDPSNPGGTGKPGRKDLVAASTFRSTFASNAGLRNVEVMPVMLVVGSSPINPMPYQAGFPLDNYWWNPTTNAPGPDLVYADNIVKTLGRPLDYFIESGPGETTGVPYAPEEDRPAILAAWRTSNIAMLNWMRANWGNPSLEIWFQGASTSWWGDFIPPQEVNWLGANLIRTLQTYMAENDPGFKLGSYVTNGGSYVSYLNEMDDGLGWVHYSLDAYHSTAREMATNMATDTNIALLPPPTWVTMHPPANISAVRQAGGDILITWDVGSSPDAYIYKNLHAATMGVISEGSLTTNSYVFTVADQLAAYGVQAGYIIFEVGEYIIEGNITGPLGRYEAATTEPNVPVPQNLIGSRNEAGDITFVWDVVAGATAYTITNFHAGTGAILKTENVTVATWVWTYAQQVADYGFGAGYVHFEVSAIVNGITGPAAYFNDSIA